MWWLGLLKGSLDMESNILKGSQWENNIKGCNMR